MKEALLAAVRDPEGEDAHGFDPALIFRRYLVTTPSEQQQAGANPNPNPNPNPNWSLLKQSIRFCPRYTAPPGHFL